MHKEKIGLGIVTYNSENYFQTLFNSINKNVLDELVVVNGGEKYTNRYNCDWIQHNTNMYPAQSRNDCITFLKQKSCKHIFICEDDMIIKNSDIFAKYIHASNISGIKYLSYVSTSFNSGSPTKRTPKLIVKYPNNVSISLYANMCNEFTYHHVSCFDKVGLYDTQFRDPFDIDMAYRESGEKYASPFWWFADITNSDLYIENNPIAVSRLQNDRPDGKREQRIQEQWHLFYKKHGYYVNQIPLCTREQVIDKLKNIKT